jgi:broad specificity phosphatase PhoE
MPIVAYFVRHGETGLNKEKAFRGPIDIELNNDGKKQAEELANFFKDTSFSSAFTSDKKRTKETAKIVLGNRKIQPKKIKQLDSYNVGDLSGKPKNEENMALVKYYQEHPDETIPGGESLNKFRKDADPKIMMIIKRGEASDKPVIAFVHSSIIHELSHLLHGDHQMVKVRPGGVVAVSKTKNGKYKAIPLLKESKHTEDKSFGS